MASPARQQAGAVEVESAGLAHSEPQQRCKAAIPVQPRQPMPSAVKAVRATSPVAAVQNTAAVGVVEPLPASGSTAAARCMGLALEAAAAAHRQAAPARAAARAGLRSRTSQVGEVLVGQRRQAQEQPEPRRRPAHWSEPVGAEEARQRAQARPEAVVVQAVALVVAAAVVVVAHLARAAQAVRARLGK